MGNNSPSNPKFLRLITRGWSFTQQSLFFVVMLAAFVVLPMIAPTSSQAVTDCSPDGIKYAGSNWLSGGGVNVCNQDIPDLNTLNYVNNINNVSTQSGYKWECVELVNRLFLLKGWITPRWSGNGNTMANNVPSGLLKQNNRSISYLNPGDVITLDDGGYGHAAIIESVNLSTNTITIINQNTQNATSTAYIESGSFSSGNIDIHMNGWGSYDVQAVIHQPGSGGGAGNTDDFTIFRPDSGYGYWYSKFAPSGTSDISWVWGVQHGDATDKPLAGRFNSDGYDDFAVYHPSGGTGYWYVRNGVNTGDVIFNGLTHGNNTDMPVTGNFDSYANDDFGIVRPDVNGSFQWYFKSSYGSNGQTPIWGAYHGSSGDIPVTGDFNNDGIDDFGIYRSVGGTATWYFKSGANGQQISTIWGVTHGGQQYDVPVVGDVNGDNIDDYGIGRPDSNGSYVWYFKSGASGHSNLAWGIIHGGTSTNDKLLMGNFGQP